jgi:hypothetical protein
VWGDAVSVLTVYFRWRTRLEVDHVLSRRPAEQVQDDDALRLAGPRATAPAFPRSEELR